MRCDAMRCSVTRSSTLYGGKYSAVGKDKVPCRDADKTVDSPRARACVRVRECACAGVCLCVFVCVCVCV